MKRRELLLLPLMIVAALSLVLAFTLRFDFVVHYPERRLLVVSLCLFVPLKGLAYFSFRLHRIWWRVVGLFDLLRLALANFAGSVAACLLCSVAFGTAFPRSVYIIDFLVCFLLSAGLLFSFRLYVEVLVPRAGENPRQKQILIYGAGAAGLTLAKEIRSNPKLNSRIAGFLDDEPTKRDGAMLGINVLGEGRDAARLVARARRRQDPISEIVIAMPSASGKQMRVAIANCRAAGVPFRTVPSLGELLVGKVLSSQLRHVSVNDLLGREPVHIDETAIRETIAGRTVMVTGGCGSIGSELCRQLVRFQPGKLVIFDQAESEMFMLAMDLQTRHPALNLATVLGDITRMPRVMDAMERHAVDVVFHAAAYKHVPLVESNLIEAVENNVIGTYNVAEAAHRLGLGKVVLISSDKAVNPSSMMGVTKRVAELLVSAMPLDAGPRQSTFVSVRFGNVLASAGSVVQIFQRQIAAGGPVTITHPEMRRYFMTVPEAVQLVLQASAMGKGSEIFVLDMGEPVRIVDLAGNMIRLAGLTPDEDIEVRFTGLRPGEKLFEELHMQGEDMLPTYHEKIKIFRSEGPSPKVLAQWLETLRFMLKHQDAEEVKRHLIALAPTYQPGTASTGETPVEGLVQARG